MTYTFRLFSFSGDASRAGADLRNPHLAYQEYVQRVTYESLVFQRHALAQAQGSKSPDPAAAAAAAAAESRMADYARLAQTFARELHLSSLLPVPLPVFVNS